MFNVADEFAVMNRRAITTKFVKNKARKS